MRGTKKFRRVSSSDANMDVFLEATRPRVHSIITSGGRSLRGSVDEALRNNTNTHFTSFSNEGSSSIETQHNASEKINPHRHRKTKRRYSVSDTRSLAASVLVHSNTNKNNNTSFSQTAADISLPNIKSSNIHGNNLLPLLRSKQQHSSTSKTIFETNTTNVLNPDLEYFHNTHSLNKSKSNTGVVISSVLDREHRLLLLRKSSIQNNSGRSIESIKNYPFKRGVEPLSKRGLTLISHNIVLGGRDEAANEVLLASFGITHILNVAKQIPNYHENDFIYENVSILDSPEVELKPCIGVAMVFMKNAECLNGRVFVHCIAGVSRSVSIIIIHLMTNHNICLAHAFGYVLTCRPFINPNEGFKLQMAKMENELFGFSTVSKNAGKHWDFYAWNQIKYNYKFRSPNKLYPKSSMCLVL